MHYYNELLVDFVCNNNIQTKKLFFVKIDINKNCLTGSDFYGFPMKIELDNVLDVGENNVNFKRRVGKTSPTKNRRVQQKVPSKRVQRSGIRIYK